MTRNKSLDRTVIHRGQTALAIDCWLAGLEERRDLAGQFNR